MKKDYRNEFNKIKYLMEYKINDYLNDNSSKKMLFENRESKNINLARKYLKNNGYDDSNSQEILDNIRTSIPNSRLGQCKFLLGAARLYLNGELNNGENINTLNKLLPYIASNTHINEYDNNLNNLTLYEIINRFETVRQNDSEESRKQSYSKQHIKNNDYNIVKIPNFETANKYSKYTSWCVTQDINMYNNYTNNGVGLFYFCLKNGFENIPKKQGENSPLDEYGLSMIAVSITEDGEPNTITSRWNHEMGGNDNVMTKDELEKLLGVNFYETFKPYTEEELLAKGLKTKKMAKKMLAQGFPLKEIFDEIDKVNDNIIKVKLNDKYSLVNKNGELIGNGKLWFDDVSNFSEGFAIVEMNNKWSFVNKNGELIKNGNLWFDDISYFHNEFAIVEMNNKWSFINKNGELIGNGKLWFDFVWDFSEGFAKVRLNDKISLINKNGELVGNGKLWFDDAEDFSNGFAIVEMNNEYSFINTKGELIGNGKLWFDTISYFSNGFAMVEMNNEYSFINKNGELIGNGKLWFDDVSSFSEGFAKVEMNDECSYINTDGELIGNGKLWFDDGSFFKNGFSKVRLRNKWSFINKNGELIGNGKLWFDFVWDFSEGFAIVEINDNEFAIDTHGNFYDYKTKQPIPNPLVNQQNESIEKIVKNIVKETIKELLIK